MESLDTVNTERKAIIDTLKTEKALNEVTCVEEEKSLEKELGAPIYSGIEIVYIIKNFLKSNKSLRAIDQRIIKEMEEWLTAVKKVVVGVESQESKLKQQGQMYDTSRKQIDILKAQIDTLKAKIKQQGGTIPEFKESIKVIDEEIKEIEKDRLTDEQLERGKHLFKVEGQIELICWYLYNKSETPMDIDKNLEFSPNTTNTLISLLVREDRKESQYFKKVDKIGRKVVYTMSEKGKEYVERIIRNKK